MTIVEDRYIVHAMELTDSFQTFDLIEALEAVKEWVKIGDVEINKENGLLTVKVFKRVEMFSTNDLKKAEIRVKSYNHISNSKNYYDAAIFDTKTDSCIY